jgi:hypothetical protein
VQLWRIRAHLALLDQKAPSGRRFLPFVGRRSCGLGLVGEFSIFPFPKNVKLCHSKATLFVTFLVFLELRSVIGPGTNFRKCFFWCTSDLEPGRGGKTNRKASSLIAKAKAKKAHSFRLRALLGQQQTKNARRGSSWLSHARGFRARKHQQPRPRSNAPQSGTSAVQKLSQFPAGFVKFSNFGHGTRGAPSQ